MICENKAYLFSLNRKENIYKAPSLLKKFDMFENETGIGCLLSYKQRNVAILPANTENAAQIYDSETGEVNEFDIGVKPIVLSGNLHGEVFAYADQTGTAIRIHKINDGTLVKEFDRGTSHVEITSIAFDKFCFRMAITSKKETVHVFSLPKKLAFNGKSPEEVKKSFVPSDYENDKSLPSSLLESRVNERPGLFKQLIYGSKSDKSYLKVYIESPNKTWSIVDGKLLILTDTGNLYSIDIQEKGSYYSTSKEVSSVALIKNESNS